MQRRYTLQSMTRADDEVEIVATNTLDAMSIATSLTGERRGWVVQNVEPTSETPDHDTRHHEG